MGTEGGGEVGERSRPDSNKRKIPNPDILDGFELIDKHTEKDFLLLQKMN